MADSFITTMGLFWKAEDVFWGQQRNPGSLLGVPADNRTSARIDFREQIGIYVLYQDYSIVYVGQTGSKNQKLFARLRQHRKYLAGRWNRFSWFGIRRVVGRGRLSVQKDGIHTSLSTMLNHLEGVLLQATEPSLNGQEGRFGDKVKRYEQVRDKRLGLTEKQMLELLCRKNNIDPRGNGYI